LLSAWLTGFRIASSDTDGNLVIGPKVVTGNSVEAFAGVGQYIYFGYKNYDSISTGIGRMDLSVFISPNQPAYASDLMVTGQGAVTDIHEFQNEPVFSVSGLGVYTKHANLVTSGYLESGIYRWGVPRCQVHTQNRPTHLPPGWHGSRVYQVGQWQLSRFLRLRQPRPKGSNY
jgi:hypothetical protein